MPSLEMMFWKRALHKYIHIYAYINMWKALLKRQFTNLVLTFEIHYFGMPVLEALWKRALHI